MAGAHIPKAELSFGHPTDAKLSGADLSGIDLSGVDLTKRQLDEACGTDVKKLNPQLDPPLTIKPCPKQCRRAFVGFDLGDAPRSKLPVRQVLSAASERHPTSAPER